MLSFLARTFLLLAAAFGLGAIGGRATRRPAAPKAAEPRLPNAGSGKALGSTPVADRPAAPETLLAGAIAGETGSEVGGSNMLAESPAAPSPRSASAETPDAVAGPATRGATSDEAAAAIDVTEAAGDGAAEPSLPSDPDDGSGPQAAFASYGGSGVSAGFERVEETAPPAASGSAEKGPLRARSRWSEPSPATATPASEGLPSVAASSPGNAAPDGLAHHPLSAPDLHGRTPPSDAREGMPEDPLAAKHRSDSFDSDFRTIDYSSLGDAPSPRPASGVGATDDGWTVPEEGGLAGQPVFEESPAAFRSGGGSAPLRGAPEGVGATDDGPEASATPSAPAASAAASADPDAGVDEPVAPPSSRPPPVVPATEPPAGHRLEAARGGVPDDLTRISGIGPSIERLLFENGVFHFDQIAAWNAADAEWADALSGFRGRVMRERWIDQARAFAETD